MKKLLIVDDEPNIVMSLEFVFKKENYKVFIARDGAEAIEIIENSLPDIILLDIMMPKVDGYQVLKHLKEVASLNKIKVIILSAKNKIADIELGLQLGADKYISKPFSTRQLVKEVKKLLNKK
ncbi:MAG: response regulator [Flavobacteriaceae bacterium]